MSLDWIRIWSRELFQIHGLDPANGPPTSEQYLAIVHPEDRQFMASMMKRMISDNSGFDVTKRIVRASGEVRYVRCVGTAVSDNVASRRIGVGIDVTEHEVLTRELRRREAYLAEAQRLSHTGSFGWKTSNGEIVWSDETYHIFEYDRTEKPTLDMLVQRLHPQDRAPLSTVLDRASQAGTDFEHEYRLLLADGRVKYVHAIAHALQDASGNGEFIGAVSDITERKTAEEKIRRNERELRTLVEAIPAFVGTALPDGSVDFISQNWLDYAGLSREQGMGWGWESAVHPEDSDRVIGNWRAALAAGKPVEHEVRCRRADGNYQWFLYRSLPLRDDGGNILKWYATLTNIDALKQIECALQTREQELVGIIETIPSMLWSTSPTGEVNSCLVKESLNIVGSPSKNSLIACGRESFIQMIGRRLRRRSPGQSALESHTAQFTACDAQMESTDGITQWASLCVILRARSFNGMASRSTSMSENEQKTIFATRVSNSQKLRDWRPSLNLQARSLTN